MPYYEQENSAAATVGKTLLVTRGSYAVAAVFPAPHCVNGSADIWLRASLVWKAIAVALNIHHQRKPALAKSL